MTYSEALAAVLLATLCTIFACWYVWCIYTMFFRCARVGDFFSEAYSTSSLFVMVNAAGAIAFAAWILKQATN